MNPAQPEWDGPDGENGCPNCTRFRQQTVVSMREAESVFPETRNQRRTFGASVDRMREVGVTHACYACETWFFGMTDAARQRMEAAYPE